MKAPAYIRHVSDYTGIGPDRVLASPQERPTDWLLIGYAMAVVENGKGRGGSSNR
jgi:hypothetical protein